LPYRRVEHDTDDDDDLRAGMTRPNPISFHLDKMKRSLIGEGAGRGPDTLNVGPRGHLNQREYEARRPGDRHSSTETEEV